MNDLQDDEELAERAGVRQHETTPAPKPVMSTSTAGRPGQFQAPRRTRAVIRRFAPWSVLRMALLFYFCVMLIVLFGFAILYWILGITGVLAQVVHLLETVALAKPGFRINGTWIFEWLFVFGIIGVVAWSILTALAAVLYNLCSDVVGGIRVSLVDRGEE